MPIFTIQEARIKVVDGTWPTTYFGGPIPLITTLGYFVGGDINPGGTSTIERYDFSNETAASVVVGNLSEAKFAQACTGNGIYGYSAGGYAPYTSTVNRLTYSADTTNASVRGSLSSAKGYVTASGNASFGWYASGAPQTTAIDRIDYAADTNTATIRAYLTSAGVSGDAAGNFNYGYFTKGYDYATAGNSSRVHRLDYGNDTVNAAEKGVLPFDHRYGAATSNDNYMWIGGGNPGLSYIAKLDFGNDTATAVYKGPLSTGRRDLLPIGSTSYGWWGGGYNDPGNYRTWIDRIDYASDTSTTSVISNMTQGRMRGEGYGGYPT